MKKYSYKISLVLIIFYSYLGGTATKAQSTFSADSLYVKAINCYFTDSFNFFPPYIYGDLKSYGNIIVVILEDYNNLPKFINNAPVVYVKKENLCEYIKTKGHSRYVVLLHPLALGPKENEATIKFTIQNVSYHKNNCIEKVPMGGYLFSENTKEYISFIYDCNSNKWVEK